MTEASAPLEPMNKQTQMFSSITFNVNKVSMSFITNIQTPCEMTKGRGQQQESRDGMSSFSIRVHLYGNPTVLRRFHKP